MYVPTDLTRTGPGSGSRIADPGAVEYRPQLVTISCHKVIDTLYDRQCLTRFDRPFPSEAMRSYFYFKNRILHRKVNFTSTYSCLNYDDRICFCQIPY